MERPELERIQQGLLGLLNSGKSNAILKDFETVLIYAMALEEQLAKAADLVAQIQVTVASLKQDRKCEKWSTEDVMVKIGGGPSFRCVNCGANVFKKSLDVDLHYRCNGCDETYTGSE